MNERAETAIQRYTEWLNRWHIASGDTFEGKPVTVTRANYDEYDDPPFVIADVQVLPGSWADSMIVLTVSPYHDEGGPTVLTAWFDDEGALIDMVQEFDTLRQFIVHDGTDVALPDPAKK